MGDTEAQGGLDKSVTRTCSKKDSSEKKKKKKVGILLQRLITTRVSFANVSPAHKYLPRSIFPRKNKRNLWFIIPLENNVLSKMCASKQH